MYFGYNTENKEVLKRRFSIIISKNADKVYAFFDNVEHFLFFIAAIVLLIGVTLDAELIRGFAVGVILICICFYLCKKVYSDSYMCLLSVLSLIGHFFIAIIFNYVFKNFGADSVEYHQAAIGVDSLLSNGVSIQAIPVFKGQIFTNIVAFIYFCFGTSRVLATFIVSFFVVLAGMLVHIACVTAKVEKKAGYFASLAIWFMPGFLFFTSDLLRDGIILFLTALAFYLFAELLYKKNSKLKIVALLVAVVLVVVVNASLRFYVFVPILIGMGLGSVVCFFSNKGIRYKALIGFGFAVLVVLFFILSQRYLSRWLQLDIDTLLQTLNSTRQNEFAYASAGIKEFDISTLDKALMSLPTLMWHYIFQPFPDSWMAEGSALYIKLLIPDMILWYAMIPFLFIGSVVALKRKNFLGIAILGYLISFLVINALLVGNVGAIYRYRMQFQEFAFVVAGIGVMAVAGMRKG